MVEGLFPVAEHDTVLELLGRSVIFLTPGNIEHILTEENYPGTAWNLANLYLGSLGLEGLDGSRSCIAGLSQGTTCFVSCAYFDREDQFDDFIVHETAHIFHNWKREYANMRHTRKHEWLLQIDFHKRETFAYACEAYSRILVLGKTRKERRDLVETYARTVSPSDERVDKAEIVNILHEAAAARNGWKHILVRCAPVRRSL
jgi:hypothetical protein